MPKAAVGTSVRRALGPVPMPLRPQLLLDEVQCGFQECPADLVAAAGVEGDARPGLALPVRTSSVLSPGRPSASRAVRKRSRAAVEAFTVPWTWISSRPLVLFPTLSGYGYVWACLGWGDDQRWGLRDCPQQLEFRVVRGVILECLQSGDAVGSSPAATRTGFCVQFGCEAELLCAPRRPAG